MSGTGTARWLSLPALLCVAALAPAVASADSRKPIGTSLSQVQAPGAQTAASQTVFTIDGRPYPVRISAFIGPEGRLTLVSPEGITAPYSPRSECTQDGPTQVSCQPLLVQIIAGDLRGGADTFTAAPTLDVQVGADLAGAPDRPLSGGPGRDRITGGAANDLILGGAGPDFLSGLGSSDVIRGGGGKDTVLGGIAPDALFGGGGPDLLDGGPGRDLCNGGGGRDKGVSCTARKKIP